VAKVVQCLEDLLGLGITHDNGIIQQDAADSEIRTQLKAEFSKRVGAKGIFSLGEQAVPIGAVD
jgi:hypothetical protein